MRAVLPIAALGGLFLMLLLLRALLLVLLNPAQSRPARPTGKKPTTITLDSPRSPPGPGSTHQRQARETEP
jgi:hypothetical protein